MTNGGGSDIIGHFQAGFEIVRRHPVLVVPAVAVQIIVVVVAVVFLGGTAAMFAVGGPAGGTLGAIAGGLLFALIVGVLSLVASGVVIVMARDAIAGRNPLIGDAVGAVMARFVDVLIASLFAMVIVGIGMFFFVLPGLIAGFFLIFTLPAVLLDGDGAIDALRRSFTVVKENIGPVVGLAIGWIVTAVVLGIVARILGWVPVLGQLASAVLFGACIAYLTVVVVRVYQALPRR